jgi:succinate dehydrogenase / fumarate reductase flavoprotein subunit
VTAEFETHDFDVVVVGAGGAGLRAAIESSALGCRTAIVCKSLLGKAHTVMAEGGIAAALGNVMADDNWKVHFRDTMRGGKLLNHWRMAQLHAEQAPDRVRELEQWGALFDRTPDGRINQRPFGGHTYSRLAHVGDRTGLEMIRTLQDRGVHQGIDVFMETTITRLLKDAGRVVGAIGYARESGRIVVFRAKAVVLATGGIGKCYRVTSNSWEYTGDGHALAYEAGADLIDMEFMQFHPTGMVWPLSVSGILVTEGVRGEGGILRNKDGKRFMFERIPPMFKGEFAESEAEADRWVAGDKKNNRRPPELLTRDEVARSINREVKEGRGSPHGGVFLDIASKRTAEDIKKKLPSMYHQFMQLAQVDITREPMEVGPTAHYVMGGVRVHPETQESTVPGLFAAGEVGAGLHGANRLGGNSLSDLLVFGKLAGEAAANAARRVEHAALDEASIRAAAREMLAPFDRPDGENPYAIQSDLQKMMERRAGIIRNEADLLAGLEALGGLRARADRAGVTGSRQYNPGWHTAMDLRNLLICSEMLIRAALERKESRGAHTRDDFPDTDKTHWGKVNVVLRRAAEGMRVVQEPLPPPPPELQELLK